MTRGVRCERSFVFRFSLQFFPPVTNSRRSKRRSFVKQNKDSTDEAVRPGKVNGTLNPDPATTGPLDRPPNSDVNNDINRTAAHRTTETYGRGTHYQYWSLNAERGQVGREIQIRVGLIHITTGRPAQSGQRLDWHNSPKV